MASAAASNNNDNDGDEEMEDFVSDIQGEIGQFFELAGVNFDEIPEDSNPAPSTSHEQHVGHENNDNDDHEDEDELGDHEEFMRGIQATLSYVGGKPGIHPPCWMMMQLTRLRVFILCR
eukprot:gb/GECG01004507.1/.p1 GENE.gb/GECG01004507.1/~~gb/GECG01004507.1/.p1  ORF type:complete len:119 (+),score=23.96 gb/GECG01004507.1/:1-357(+)